MTSEKPREYRVQIDKTFYEVPNPTPTGRELLQIAGKVPVDKFALYQKPQGGQPIRIALDQHVDLREPGIERFLTLPLDQTEGHGAVRRTPLRRDFTLPHEDTEWLVQHGKPYELVAQGGVRRLVIYDWSVPTGYNQSEVDVHVRIETGYPDTQIDMAYFAPALVRRDGRGIANVCSETFDSRPWQRWSRHRTPANPWRPGLDCLATHFELITSWLVRELKK